MRAPSCPACLPAPETRAAKRVRPRAFISHQITLVGGRVGGIAGVTCRFSPCSPSHPASPRSGGGYQWAAQKCGRGVGLRQGPSGREQEGGRISLTSPCPGRRRTCDPGVGMGTLISLKWELVDPWASEEGSNVAGLRESGLLELNGSS